MAVPVWGPRWQGEVREQEGSLQACSIATGAAWAPGHHPRQIKGSFEGPSTSTSASQVRRRM